MKVRALKKGYDGKQLREKGDVFDYEGKLGSWMEPLEKAPKEKKEQEQAPKEKAPKK